MIDEMALFATFSADTRRFIVRSLDFGLPRGDPMKRWVGSFFDMGALAARADLFHAVPIVRDRLITSGAHLARQSDEFTVIQRCADFDLRWPEISHFVAFSFLYDRLFGPKIRPCLATIFTSAASSPGIAADHRARTLSTITMFDFVDHDNSALPSLFLPDWDGD